MKDKRTEASPKTSSTKRTTLSLQVIAIIAVVLIALLFFVWHQKNFRSVSDIPGVHPDHENSLPEEISIPEQVVSTVFTEDARQNPPPPALPSTSGYDSSEDAAGGLSSDSLKGQEDDAIPPVAENRPGLTDSGSAVCEETAGEIREFYQHLDRQDYVKSYNFIADCEAHFSSLIQKLLDNPPVVSGERDDLYTILQNTAHFFRIIGKENILALKTILDREKDLFENVLADFYSLLHIPSCLEENFNLKISQSSLYDYAGFFLNTMGGRLYLFRRDSMSRMVVSYYAIRLIDQANKNAGNRHGIELSGAIDQLINEIESTANTLQLKDTYLNDLYSLKEEYQ